MHHNHQNGRETNLELELRAELYAAQMREMGSYLVGQYQSFLAELGVRVSTEDMEKRNISMPEMFRMLREQARMSSLFLLDLSKLQGTPFIVMDYPYEEGEEEEEAEYEEWEEDGEDWEEDFYIEDYGDAEDDEFSPLIIRSATDLRSKNIRGITLSLACNSDLAAELYQVIDDFVMRHYDCVSHSNDEQSGHQPD